MVMYDKRLKLFSEYSSKLAFFLIIALSGVAVILRYPRIIDLDLDPIPLALFINSLAVYFLAVLIALRDSANIRNTSFSLFLCFFNIWSVSNYYASLQLEPEVLIIFIRIIMASAILYTVAYLIFISSSIRGLFLGKAFFTYALLAISAVYLSLTDGVYLAPENIDSYPAVQPGMILVVLVLILSSFYIFFKLVRSKGSENKANSRSRIILILFSLYLLVIIPSTNLVLAIVLQTKIFSAFATYYLALFTALVSLALFFKDVFVLRKELLRVTAYSFTLVVFCATYVALVVTVGWHWAGDTSTKTSQLIVIFLSVVSGLALVPSIKIFSTIARLFFRVTHYKTNQVLDQIADALISREDLGSLLESMLEKYTQAIKPSRSYVAAIKDGMVISQHGYRSGSFTVEPKLIDLINPKWKVRSVESLPESKLKGHLKKHDFELLSTTAHNGKLNGIFLFSFKESGTQYTNQDVELLTISGKNLSLAIENAKNFQQIKLFNIQLKKEIKQATKELKEANRKLKKIDKSKDDFISMASHQLRTPLTVTKNVTYMLRNGHFGRINKQQKTALDKSYSSIERIAKQVNDLLDVSRIDAGTFRVNLEEVSVNDFVSRCISQSQNHSELKGVSINASIPERKVTAEIDKAKLNEVLSNFIDNAIQYSNKGSSVDVTVETTSKTARIKVIDTGIGISKSDQENLFTKFFRTKKAQNHRPDGTGLGLYIAKKVIDDHNGEIIFRSATNKGSTFGFELPITS